MKRSYANSGKGVAYVHVTVCPAVEHLRKNWIRFWPLEAPPPLPNASVAVTPGGSLSTIFTGSAEIAHFKDYLSLSPGFARRRGDRVHVPPRLGGHGLSPTTEREQPAHNNKRHGAFLDKTAHHRPPFLLALLLPDFAP
jgi:hypothetical protein